MDFLLNFLKYSLFEKYIEFDTNSKKTVVSILNPGNIHLTRRRLIWYILI